MRHDHDELHLHVHLDDQVVGLLSKIVKGNKNIMAAIQDLAPVLATISSELDKVSLDTDNLLAQLANIPTGGLTPEQQAAIDSAVESATTIATRLQALDDKVPDLGQTSK